MIAFILIGMIFYFFNASNSKFKINNFEKIVLWIVGFIWVKVNERIYFKK